MFYQFSMRAGTTETVIDAPVVANLPVVTKAAPVAAVLPSARGSTEAGLYIQVDHTWRKVVPYDALNNAMFSQVKTVVYSGLSSPVYMPGSQIYLNGGLHAGTQVLADGNLWATVTPVQGSQATQAAVTFQAYVPRLSGSGNYGVLTQWFAVSAFTLSDFTNSKIVFAEPADDEDLEMPYSLSKNGVAFAQLTYKGIDSQFHVDSFQPTEFAVGDLLAFSQDSGFQNMPALTILISNKEVQ